MLGGPTFGRCPLRKGFQLALLYLEKRHYQTFADDLLIVYRQAKRAQSDQRLSAAGRECEVVCLENRIWEVAAPHQKIWESPSTPDERDFADLVLVLFRLVEQDFVQASKRVLSCAFYANWMRRMFPSALLEALSFLHSRLHTVTVDRFGQHGNHVGLCCPSEDPPPTPSASSGNSRQSWSSLIRRSE